MQQKNTIIWCMLTQIWRVARHNFLSFQAIFCFFAQLLTPTIKIWKKIKKTPGHITLLHMCTINQDHTMYGFWDMKFNGQNFLVILGNFLPFYPLTPWKMKISKMKKPLEISSFFTSVPKIMIIRYVPEIWHGRFNYFYFELSGIFPSTFLQQVNGHKISYEIL